MRLCLVMIWSVCACVRDSVCVYVGANVDVHEIPSVRPQSEISLVANHGKTQRWPQVEGSLVSKK